MGLWNKLKALGKKDAGKAVLDAGQKVGQVTDTYTPTLKKVPGAVWAGGATVAGAGLAIAGGAGRAARKGVLALQGHNTVIFLILAAAVHFGNVSRGVVTLSVSDVFFWLDVLFLPMLAAFLFYKDEDSPFPVRNIGKFVFIGFIAYALPVLLSMGVAKGWLPDGLATVLLFAAPGWIIFIFLNPGGSKVTQFLAGIFFLVWTLFILVSLLNNGLLGSQQVTAQLLGYDNFKVQTAQTYTLLKDKLTGGVKQTISGTKNFINGSMSVATQDYYQGQVDQSQGQPAGVSITDTRTALTRFDAQLDDISVFATMKAKSFSDSISVRNGCYLDVPSAQSMTKFSEKNVSGAVQPPTVTVEYTGAYQDQFDLECDIKQTNYSTAITSSAVSATVVFNSTFPFETWAYVPYSFIDKDLGVSLRRVNKDPAVEMGVQSRPIAKYTPGPVSIGMATDSQPYFFTQPTSQQFMDVNFVQPSLPAFGLTISNLWQGKGNIVNISLIQIYVPKPFLLDMDNCVPLKSDTNNIKTNIIRSINGWEDNPSYNEYNLTDLEIRPNEMFTTFRCPLVLENATPVLGTSGAGVYTFFVHANYTYELDTRVAVSIRGDPAMVQAASQASTAASGVPLGAQSPNKALAVTNCDTQSNCNTNGCSCSYTQDNHDWSCSWKSGAYATRVCWYTKTATLVYRCAYSAAAPSGNCADVTLGTPVNTVSSPSQCADNVQCATPEGGATICTCSFMSPDYKDSSINHIWTCRWSPGAKQHTCYYYLSSTSINYCKYALNSDVPLPNSCGVTDWS